MTNPLLSPAYTPDFAAIKAEHFLPAVKITLSEAAENAARIRANAEAPTFANTILPLSRLFVRTGYALGTLGNLKENAYSKKLSDIAEKTDLAFDAASKDVYQDRTLAARVKAVYDQRDTLGLDDDDLALLRDTYGSFESAGQRA